jgi:hypothetical protein
LVIVVQLLVIRVHLIVQFSGNSWCSCATWHHLVIVVQLLAIRLQLIVHFSLALGEHMDKFGDVDRIGKRMVNLVEAEGSCCDAQGGGQWLAICVLLIVQFSGSSWHPFATWYNMDIRVQLIMQFLGISWYSIATWPHLVIVVQLLAIRLPLIVQSLGNFW